MKIDYSKEIENLISNTFSTASKDVENAKPKTLEEIHTMVINILPPKWVYQTDVYTALQNLNFTASYGKKDSKDGLYYFVLLK